MTMKKLPRLASARIVRAKGGGLIRTIVQAALGSKLAYFPDLERAVRNDVEIVEIKKSQCETARSPCHAFELSPARVHAKFPTMTPSRRTPNHARKNELRSAFE